MNKGRYKRKVGYSIKNPYYTSFKSKSLVQGLFDGFLVVFTLLFSNIVFEFIEGNLLKIIMTSVPSAITTIIIVYYRTYRNLDNIETMINYIQNKKFGYIMYSVGFIFAILVSYPYVKSPSLITIIMYVIISLIIYNLGQMKFIR